MISESEYLRFDAVGLAELVRRGEVSASELLEAAIARADSQNPSLNAIVIPMHELARARARTRLEGPLAGVPFLVKDLYQDCAGVLATSGCAAYRRGGFTPQVDSEIVRRWLAAGTVIFGRANTCEFGAKGITEPEAWGPTRNPWNLERTPGGSSGGSAAAVAAGIVPVAGGNDGGGSIRIPAAYTGLFGLKPGRGRTPWGPGMGEMMHGAAMNHVLSRSVRDSALLLDLTWGYEPGGCFEPAPPERPYAEEAARDPGRLRIAFSTRSPLGTEVDPGVIKAVERTAKLLSDLGHSVEPAEPKLDGPQLARDFLHVWYAQNAQQMAKARALVPAHPRAFELDSFVMEALANARSGPDYVAAYLRWLDYGCALAEFLGTYQLYMTPTLAMPAPRIGELAPPPLAATTLRALQPFGLGRLLPFVSSIIERMELENLRRVPFTQLANLTGVPAMSVPLQQFPDGMPLGIQFLAGHGGEGLLFALAGQLERAAPWAERRPPSAATETVAAPITSRTS
ncbi:MAG TPA: amidase [Polyangiales bacterium]|nr:amidase [Polyangiales bacterium]